MNMLGIFFFLPQREEKILFGYLQASLQVDKVLVGMKLARLVCSICSTWHMFRLEKELTEIICN